MINDGLFSECRSLGSVVIPIGIKEIRDYAFSGCKSLKVVRFKGKETYISENAFGDCDSLEKIIVPYGSKSFYKDWLSDELHSKIIELPVADVCY